MQAERSGRERRDTPPEVLSTASTPDDLDIVEFMLLRAIAGLDIGDARLRRVVADAESLRPGAQPILWHVFQGLHWQIDLAALLTTLDRRSDAEPWLARAEQQLATYERQGNAWHALPFHRARIEALRGRTDAALKALAAAAEAGCRRGWRLRLDPSFASLRADATFDAVRKRIEETVGQQRRALSIG
jgi:hypothetical protein